MNSRVLSLFSVAVLALGGLVSCTPGDDDTIVLINRQNSSGTYKYFQDAVLAKKDYKTNTKDQSGSQAVVDLVGSTPNAIGYSGMGYKTDKVKMLLVSKEKGGAGVAPTVANAQDGSYPITRPLQFYTNGDPKGAMLHYVDWILSEEGQGIVAAKGYVPVKPRDLGSAPPPAGDHAFQVTGSDTMVQLAQAWAEAYSKKFPNVKVQVTGGGSGVGIAGMIDGSVDIANASRKMKATEKATAQKNGINPVEWVVGQDALAVYVHKDNPLNSVSIPELAEVYAEGGTISKWGQLGSAAK